MIITIDYSEIKLTTDYDIFRFLGFHCDQEPLETLAKSCNPFLQPNAQIRRLFFGSTQQLRQMLSSSNSGLNGSQEMQLPRSRFQKLEPPFLPFLRVFIF